MPSSVAVTRTAVAPAPSPIALGIPSSPAFVSTDRVSAVGVSSSSTMVSVFAAGTAIPCPPEAVADTVTVLSGASMLLSTAARVTTPVLVRLPAAMVSALPACVKSPATAGDTAAADTVSVTAALEARSSVAVTALVPLVAPPFSSMLGRESTRLTTGRPSLSSRVIAAGVTATPESVPSTLIVSSGSSTASSVGVSVKSTLPLACPAAMVRLRAATLA